MATTDLVLAPKTFALVQAGLVTAGDQAAADVSQAASVVIHAKNNGLAPMVAGGFTFEGSVDSTNGVNGTWFAIQMARTNDGTVELNTGLALAVGAGNTFGWEASVAGLRWFRVRCSTTVTATSIAYWSIARSSAAVEPAPAIQPHVVNTPAGSAYSQVSAATTNAAVIKASAGNLMELTLSNVTAAIQYVKLYNKATAPTVGTDIPILTIAVAVNGTVTLNLGTLGKRFTTGIAIAATAAQAATDVAATAAGAQYSATYI